MAAGRQLPRDERKPETAAVAKYAEAHRTDIGSDASRAGRRRRACLEMARSRARSNWFIKTRRFRKLQRKFSYCLVRGVVGTAPGGRAGT